MYMRVCMHALHSTTYMHTTRTTYACSYAGPLALMNLCPHVSVHGADRNE